MDLHLHDRIAIVTGASSGIGLAVTRALVDEGARVVTGSRSVSPALQELVDTGHVRAVSVDLTTAEAPGRLVEEADGWGGLDILVNNVGGVTPRPTGFLDIDDDAWQHSFALNFFAAMRMTRAAIPLLRARGGGNIVMVGSVNAYLPDPFVIDYSAAKAAVWNLTKALSQEFGPDGIRVNSISPGPVETPLWLGEHGVAATLAALNGTDAATAQQAAIEQSGFATGRFTRPEEVADLVVLLASDRAGNVTGSDVLIDGGLTRTL